MLILLGRSVDADGDGAGEPTIGSSNQQAGAPEAFAA
jgi:hypothetical protein